MSSNKDLNMQAIAPQQSSQQQNPELTRANLSLPQTPSLTQQCSEQPYLKLARGNMCLLEAQPPPQQHSKQQNSELPGANLCLPKPPPPTQQRLQLQYPKLPGANLCLPKPPPPQQHSKQQNSEFPGANLCLPKPPPPTQQHLQLQYPKLPGANLCLPKPPPTLMKEATAKSSKPDGTRRKQKPGSTQRGPVQVQNQMKSSGKPPTLIPKRKRIEPCLTMQIFYAKNMQWEGVMRMPQTVKPEKIGQKKIIKSSKLIANKEPSEACLKMQIMYPESSQCQEVAKVPDGTVKPENIRKVLMPVKPISTLFLQETTQQSLGTSSFQGCNELHSTDTQLMDETVVPSLDKPVSNLELQNRQPIPKTRKQEAMISRHKKDVLSFGYQQPIIVQVVQKPEDKQRALKPESSVQPQKTNMDNLRKNPESSLPNPVTPQKAGTTPGLQTVATTSGPPTLVSTQVAQKTETVSDVKESGTSEQSKPGTQGRSAPVGILKTGTNYGKPETAQPPHPASELPGTSQKPQNVPSGHGLQEAHARARSTSILDLQELLAKSILKKGSDISRKPQRVRFRSPLVSRTALERASSMLSELTISSFPRYTRRQAFKTPDLFTDFPAPIVPPKQCSLSNEGSADDMNRAEETVADFRTQLDNFSDPSAEESVAYQILHAALANINEIWIQPVFLYDGEHFIMGYELRDRRGMSLFTAIESYEEHALCCEGKKTSILLTIFDTFDNPVFLLRRPSVFYFQKMEVFAPPDELAAIIKQRCGCFKTKYKVTMSVSTTLEVVGPKPLCGNFVPNGIFRINCKGSKSHLGSIQTVWQSEYVPHLFGVKFSSDMSPKVKSVLLGTAFLVDFTWGSSQSETKAISTTKGLAGASI